MMIYWYLAIHQKDKKKNQTDLDKWIIYQNITILKMRQSYTENYSFNWKCYFHSFLRIKYIIHSWRKTWVDPDLSLIF